MAEWGFDFARLPLSYRVWTDERDWLRIEERALAPIDQAIDWGRRYGIHINLCFHRIPGYCVNELELELERLFAGSESSMQRALAAASHHWRAFAERYRDVDTRSLSFDLLNEPPWMKTHGRYVEIAETLAAAIRESSPERWIVVDGADIGQTPVPDLVPLGTIQSTRGYLPKMVSHHTATWVPPSELESFERPTTWPMRDAGGTLWDRAELERRLILPWQPLAQRGVPVHVGEWGCFNATPHHVALAWMRDMLSLWKHASWGHALWNLRGPFGVVDSGRTDIRYERWRGHALDRQMLELLLEY